MSTDLVVLGDSVMWGQGLLEQHKSSTLAAAGLSAKYPGIAPVTIAHSGAVIGKKASCSTKTCPGEVPEHCPAILQQIDAYQGDPLAVPVVLLDGGINDIDIRTILNPFTLPSRLSSDIHEYCYQDMGYLLTQVKARFSHPDTRIVVTSYFPIISSKSNLDRLVQFMEYAGAPLPQLTFSVPMVHGNPIVDKIVQLCTQFWNESNKALAKAVSDVNIGTGPRCFFANVPFTANNSVFAPDAWLWGIGPAPDFAPEDEVASTRRPQCDIAQPTDWLAREQCYRAAGGHPQVTGAQQYAAAILSVLQ